MALNITQYVDPGVYVGEVIVPGSVSVSTVPLTVCLIGSASRVKQAANEAVTRGLVTGEALTVGGTPGSHNAVLENIGNRKSAQTTVTRDGVEINSQYVTYLAAKVEGGALTTLDFTTSNKIGLSMDGLQHITIAIVGGGSDLTTIAGNLVTQRLGSISDIDEVTPAQIAEGLNKALAGAASLGYGPAYGAVASVSSSKVVLTSPLGSSPSSDIKLFQAFPASHSATADVFGVSLPFQAATEINIANALYNSASVYEISYVALDVADDALLNDDVQAVSRVGSYAGVTSFKPNIDYTVDGDSLSWGGATHASLTSSIAAASHDLSSNNRIVLSVDGKPSVNILLDGMNNPPPGYADPADNEVALPAEIAANINAVLSYTPGYGPLYGSVASVSGSGSSSKLVLTSPLTGVGSMVTVAAPALNSAVTALFGLTATQLPLSKFGVGRKPAAGAIYFATYTYTRPESDYNLPKRFFTPDALYADLGAQADGNQLALAGGICFDNDAPSVITIQVDDRAFPGNPQQPEISAALDAATTTAATTEIVVLNTSMGVQAEVVAHVENQNSPTEQHPRRGWFGMAPGTLIGDADTPDTYLFAATRTFQVSPDSPGRGRLILVAPSEAVRNITTSTGAIQAIDLDGSFIAAAIAARMTSFTSPAETLLRKSIVGFDVTSFPTYLKGERSLLASNGVTVVTLNGGQLLLTDPISTEAGGGKLVTFSEISASTQKDAVTTAVTDTLDSNLVGVVPSDEAAFLRTIKSFISGVLNSLIASGGIGPFKNDDGTTREIDLNKDIQVFQDPNDPTKYQFKYFFNLRLPAKRFFGQYSVNNPFF